jgi:hypothetical protein
LIYVRVVHPSDQPDPVESPHFVDIKGFPVERFGDVFGDTYVSRILEGGEFMAVISVNGYAELARRALSTAEGHGVANARNELEEKAEVSISVSWTADGNDEKMRNGMMSLSMRYVKVLLI